MSPLTVSSTVDEYKDFPTILFLMSFGRRFALNEIVPPPCWMFARPRALGNQGAALQASACCAKKGLNAQVLRV